MSSYLEEHFPHLIAPLTETWGKPEEFGPFMFNLIYDRRGGRTGWPVEAWQELSFLEALHKLVCAAEEGPEADDGDVDDDIKWVS